MFRKMLTFSFDDGTVQDRRLIEMLDRYNLRATFNINSGFLGRKHEILHEGIRVCHDEVDIDELKKLYRNHEVAVHTCTHPNLKMCDDERIIKEVLEDIEALEKYSGKEMTGMAYPGGGDCYDERVINVLKNRTTIRYARTTDSHGTFALPSDFLSWHPTCHQNDANLFKLAEMFIEAEPEQDMLFYIWGHSFEFDKFESWETFERFCSEISGKHDITYMTNGEIYRYLSNKQQLT